LIITGGTNAGIMKWVGESINKINASKTFTNDERILLLGLFLKSF
jgi:hypothetical protein